MTALAGEPWCFPPEVLAGLTDWQIERMYFAPRDDKGQLIVSPLLKVAEVEEQILPDRAEFIASQMAQFGEPAEHWDKVYTQLLERMAQNAAGS